MEIIYNLIQENPEYFAWAFGIVNGLWGIFIYFNKQSHKKAMASLKHSLVIEQEINVPLVRKLSELEELAGEAKEIINSHMTIENKRERFVPIYEGLSKYAGQLSKYPLLMQAIRDLNQYSAIMVTDDPHKSCREDVLNFYKTLIQQSEKIKDTLKA